MASHERKLSGIGADIDRELAAAWTQFNELKQEVAGLRSELARDKALIRTLQRSQQTRGAALAKAREREAALLRQLDAIGVAVQGERPRESFFKTKATKHP
jgi:hypothetical protein